MRAVSPLDQFEYRLFGSINRIAWRAEDISAIAKFIGVSAKQRIGIGQTKRAAAIEPAEFKTADSGRRSFTFTISTATVDRMKDSVAVNGWRLDAYKKNPVVQWSHDGTMLPIGRASAVWVQGNKLKATAELAPADVNPFAERVRKMVERGFLNATSVGFAPIKFKFSEDKSRPLGIDFLEQELLEFSIVSVPANPDALIDPGQVTAMTPKAAARLRDLDLIRIRIRERAS
jgi:HK97 family phage prohead protease